MTIRTTKKFGWQPSLPDHRDYKLVHASTSLMSRPSIFTLQDNMPQVWDQLDTSSCVAHGVAAAFEYNLKIAGKTDWSPSRLFIYYNSRMIEGCANSDDGTQVRDAIKGLANYGVAHENDWPFNLKEINIKPTWHIYNLAKTNKIINYLSVVKYYDDAQKRIDSINTTIANGEPVIFGATLYESFQSDAVANSGIVPMPKVTESMDGGHCMLIVGYNDDEQMYTVRNSWGESWGLRGYCKIPYEYVSSPDLCSDFWIIRSISA
jgi:C1A family cysteine protease